MVLEINANRNQNLDRQRFVIIFSCHHLSLFVHQWRRKLAPTKTGILIKNDKKSYYFFIIGSKTGILLDEELWSLIFFIVCKQRYALTIIINVVIIDNLNHPRSLISLSHCRHDFQRYRRRCQFYSKK